MLTGLKMEQNGKRIKKVKRSLFLKKMRKNIKHQLNNNEIHNSNFSTSLIKKLKTSKKLKRTKFFDRHKMMKKNIKLSRKIKSTQENIMPENGNSSLERLKHKRNENFLDFNKILFGKRLHSESFISSINNANKWERKAKKNETISVTENPDKLNSTCEGRKFNLMKSSDLNMFGRSFSQSEKFHENKKIRAHKNYKFCINFNNFNMNENQIIHRNKIIYDYRKLLKESPLPDKNPNVEKWNQTPNTDNLCTSKEMSGEKSEENSKEIYEGNNEEKEKPNPNDNYEVETDKIIKERNPEFDNNEPNKTDEINKDSARNSRKISDDERIIAVNNCKELLIIEKVKNEKENILSKSMSNKSQKNLPEIKDTKISPKDKKAPSKENLSEVNIENPVLQKPYSSSENHVNTDLESLQNTPSLIPFQENQDEDILSDKSSVINHQDESSSISVELPIVDEEINNPKFWKRHYYYVKPPNLRDKRIACVIRAKPGSIAKKKLLKCEILNSSEEVPYLDKRENYASYIFKISPRDSEAKFQFEIPWHLAIPYFPLLNKVKEPKIMIKNEELNKWVESATNEVSFDNENQKSLNFVETKIFKPYGTFAVVSSLCKDVIILSKEGSQTTCMSDRNVSLTVPQDSLKISIHTCIQVITIDNLFWQEIKVKPGKSLLDQIIFTSSIIEIEAKKKKLSIPASVTIKLMNHMVKEQDINLKKEKNEKADDEEGKLEDDKVIPLKKELNPFQKTLLMERINNTNIVQDMHLLSYIHEEDRWFVSKENPLNFNFNKNQVTIQIPVLQSSKFVILQSKRNTTEETLAKAAKLIENEFCVRNCIIALFQSTQAPNEFALILSLKKYFQDNIKMLQEEGYTLDSKNDLVHVELHERQIITSKFVENVKNINHKTFQSVFTYNTLLPNIHKFQVQELDSHAQRAVLTFRGYLNLYITSLVKKPINNAESKIRKNQIQYTWVEENIEISHFLICINKKIVPPSPSYIDYQFKFKNYQTCFSIIKKISGKIGTFWWDLGLHLGVTETRMQSIKLRNEKKGVNKMAEHMLLFWLKGCETQENKLELLKLALKNCGRHEILDRFFKSQENVLIFGC